jgi:hypothetical protein
MAMLTTRLQEIDTMTHSSAKHIKRCRGRSMAPYGAAKFGGPQFNGFLDLPPPTFKAFLGVFEGLSRPDEQ